MSKSTKSPKNITAIRTFDAKGVATLTVEIDGKVWTTTGKRAANAASVIIAGGLVDETGKRPADISAADAASIGVQGVRSDAARAMSEAAAMTKLNKYGRRYSFATVQPVVEQTDDLAETTANVAIDLGILPPKSVEAKSSKKAKSTARETARKKAAAPKAKATPKAAPVRKDGEGPVGGHSLPRKRGTGSIWVRNTGKAKYLTACSISGQRQRRLFVTQAEAEAWLDEMTAA